MNYVVRAFAGSVRIPYRDTSRYYTDVTAAREAANEAYMVLAVTTLIDTLTVGVWEADEEVSSGEWEVTDATVDSAYYLRGKPANLL